MRYLFTFAIVAFASALSACGEEALTCLDDNGAEIDCASELPVRSQPIYGGDEVTENVAPFSSVVRIRSTTGLGSCTALKLTNNRFLTAGHCINSAKPGDTMLVSNALNGAGPVGATIGAIHIHPSFRFDPDAGDDDISSDHSYDVALIDTTPNNATPNIPPIGTSPATVHIGDGQIGENPPGANGAGLFVGYGCNPVDPDLDGHKQFAHFTAATRAAWGASAALYAREILAIETGTSREGTCSGDSGGPLFRYTAAGGYQVAGVSSTGVSDNFNDTPVRSGFARLNNIKQWLALPERLNVFANNEQGFFLNHSRRACLRHVNNNPTVTVVECDGRDQPNDREYWRLTVVPGTSNPTYFQIRNMVSARCLAAQTVGGNPTPIATPACSTSSGAHAQHWSFAKQGSTDRHKIVTRLNIPNRCLSHNVGNPDNVVTSQCNVSGSQDWYFFH